MVSRLGSSVSDWKEQKQRRAAMADARQKGEEKEEEEEEDYMGELSLFLPPEAAKTSKFSTKKDKTPITVQVVPPSMKKKGAKGLNWTEQRRVEKERKQREEDERTLANIETPIPESNIGFKLLKRMGYTPGSALGKEGSSGRTDPVGIEIRRTRVGIGREDPHKEKRKREEVEAEGKRRKEEALMADFRSTQKSHWQSKRVVVNFKKARAALDQLENKEVVVVKKSEDEEGEQGGDDEEEEEEITEEDLQEILMKLRDEYRYCLFCGFQYETVEELQSNCPGPNEDDH